MLTRMLLLFWAVATSSVANAACETNFIIQLETFGESVKVELRKGSPGNSKVVSEKNSRGGRVSFTGLCAGNYFLAIGNDESVSVTPVRYMEDFFEYNSSITMQRGSGNVKRQSRSSL